MKDLKKIIKKLKKKIKKLKNRWTLYLYINGILVKKIKIDENDDPSKQTYCITFKKRDLYKERVSVIVKPIRILKNDEKHKKTYWGAIHELGVEIGE